eukprot:TRINITY_DN13920_c0_g1_i1.p1 TRINITY_DN13920_c0_g1~~TRINITY_DN13920_c0_g1_i1.p1  ORF type:complete len:517 (-),score=126.83 TRINITY_DN13920_c0_g1_i1:54-1496(-)
MGGNRFVNREVRPDGKKKREPVVRRTVDFMAPVIRHLMVRLYRKGNHYRSYLQSSLDFAKDVEPSFVYSDQPSNAFTSKYVESRENKPSPRPVNSLCWTPEGRRLISGFHSGEITLWDGLQFNFVTIMQAHSDPVRCLTWSHNGEWLVSADDGGTVKYWQSTMNNVKAFNAHRDPIRGLTFAPTDVKFATSSDDRTVKIFDFATCQEEMVMTGHGWDVKCVHWHPKKGLLVSGGKDNLIKLWDPRTGKELGTMHGHKNTVSRVLWNQNGNWFVSASRDQLIKLWDVRMMREIYTYRGHQHEVTSIAWHPHTEELFASGDFEGNVLFWTVGWPNPQAEILAAHQSPQGAAIWDMAWHPMGHLLATGSSDKTIKFWTRNKPGDEMRDKYNVLQLPADVRNEAVMMLKEASRHDIHRSKLPPRIENYEITIEDETQQDTGPEQIPGLGNAIRLLEKERQRKETLASSMQSVRSSDKGSRWSSR